MIDTNKYFGIEFKKGPNCGIAKINVVNITTSTAIYTDALIDLYSALDEFWVFWITLDPICDYDITIENNNTYNYLAVPSYIVQVTRYLTSDPLLINNILSNMLITYHSDFPSDLHTYILTEETITNTIKTQTFNGDGVTSIFTLNGINHASEFDSFSVNGGITWRYPSDPFISWGSNAPNYDNEIMDNNYYFSIKFFDPPLTGINNIIVRYVPLVNKAYFKLITKQPHSEDNQYIDYGSHVVVTDFGIEFIL